MGLASVLVGGVCQLLFDYSGDARRLSGFLLFSFTLLLQGVMLVTGRDGWRDPRGDRATLRDG
jgi:hypothetical protein